MKKWKDIEPNLFSVLSSNDVSIQTHLMNGEDATQNVILKAIGNGETEFVAVGGDGTVNSVLNFLMNSVSQNKLSQICLGAIGIGSSNDFHKPFSPHQITLGIPHKINFSLAEPRDVGRITYKQNGKIFHRYYLTNASVGVTAAANHFYNNPDWLLKKLKRYHVQSAILYAALKTISSYNPFSAQIVCDEFGKRKIAFTNLGIMKNTHFTGNLAYHEPVQYDDGLFSIYLCSSLSKMELLKLLFDMQRGRINHGEKLTMWKTTSLRISSNQPFFIEYDGEVFTTTFVQFTILPRHLRVCQ